MEGWLRSGQPTRPAQSWLTRRPFNTLEGLLTSIKRTFGNPDKERTAHAQLHTLRMTPGMTTEEYMANFEMISGRTGFNDTALEDTYV